MAKLIDQFQVLNFIAANPGQRMVDVQQWMITKVGKNWEERSNVYDWKSNTWVKVVNAPRTYRGHYITMLAGNAHQHGLLKTYCVRDEQKRYTVRPELLVNGEVSIEKCKELRAAISLLEKAKSLARDMQWLQKEEKEIRQHIEKEFLARTTRVQRAIEECQVKGEKIYQQMIKFELNNPGVIDRYL